MPSSRALGFAIKHDLNRFVASDVFHRNWGLFNYWVPVRDVDRIIDLHGNAALFLATLVALALPLIWVGIVC